MKRSYLSIALVALASAACSVEMDEPLYTTGQEGCEIPYEVYADAARTKTVNSGLSTEWAAGDCISVYHAETGSPSLDFDGAFQITEDGLDEGLFSGGLSVPLLADAYDWYFLYPYDEKEGPRHKDRGAQVIIGAEAGSPQVQDGNDSMSHIAGENYPLYGKVLDVPSDQTPSAQMNHMASLVAVNVINNTGLPLQVTSVALEAAEPLVGAFEVDIREGGLSGSFGREETSDVAALSVENAAELADGESSKYYMGVKPFTAAAGYELTVYVNGASRTIRLKDDVEFVSGKIKTLNVSVDSLVHPVTTQEDIKTRITLDSIARIDSGYVNGVPVDHILVLGDGEGPGYVTISGTIREFINMNEFGFFTASWSGERSALTIENVTIEAEFMGFQADYIVTKERLEKYLGLELDVLVLRPAPAGNFNVSEGVHNLTILDEERHYYGLTEDDVDRMFKLIGLSVDGLRNLFGGNDYSYIEKLQILAPEHLKAYFSEDMAGFIIPAILDAKISVKLTTLEKDSDGNRLDRRLAIWGMNVYYSEDSVDC